MKRYKSWFYAAAIYNLVWGGVNIFFPKLLFEWIEMETPTYLPLWQVVGMLVLVYAPGYWWAAGNPERHYHFIVIGLLGKVLGPIGFVGAATTGQLPWSFGWTIVTNDLIWLPAFVLYLREAAKAHGGVMAILRGE